MLKWVVILSFLVEGSAAAATRSIDFDTNEGTQMSVDVSPDGTQVVFDVLGQVYRMSATGGRADCLTADSGVALNFHPRFSPDGRQIAFISDRAGQSNVWLMNRDGTQPRPLFLDREHRYATPVWSADGQSLFATRLAPTPGEGWHRRSASVWQLPLTGVPRPLLLESSQQYYVSSASRAGDALYVYTSHMVGAGASIYEAGFRLRVLDLGTGKLTDPLPDTDTDTAAPSASQSAGKRSLSYDSGGTFAADAQVAGQISPDGRYLAFAQARSGDAESARYRYSTSLFVLDTKTHSTRKLVDEITKDGTNAIAHYQETLLPGYSWTPDGRALVISIGGKIARVSVDTGAMVLIPFTARVHRILPPMTRRVAALDSDGAVPVRFIQWPTASPDDTRLVFVALGRLWIMELPNGTPRPLTPSSDDVELTPSWSADGREVAYATWNAGSRGRIQIVDANSGAVRTVSSVPAEYLWPTWTPDGGIVVLSGTGTPDPRDAWEGSKHWNIVRLSESAAERKLADDSGPLQPVQTGADGRVYFSFQWDPRAGRGILIPYPDPADIEKAGWNLASVDLQGADLRIHAHFPAGPAAQNVPFVSQTGSWLGYQADYRIFATSLQTRYVFPDPSSSTRRADEVGGAYARWHGASKIEFASGNHYVTFDITTGARKSVPISLTYVRDREPGTVALTNARIVTMESSDVIPRGNIVVRDGRLTCVGRCSIKGIDHAIDLSGKTIIPGLIDVHEHIADESSGIITRDRPRSLLPLAYGVTTVIDPAVSSTTLFPLGEMTDAGIVLGPRTFGAAEGVFGTAGGLDGAPNRVYGALVEIQSEADAEYQVARRAAWGAVTIKNYRLTDRRQQQWLIEAARHHNTSVTAEGHSLLSDMSMVMDGQTGWEHFLPTLHVYRDVVQFVARSGTTYSPTLAVAGFPDGAMFYFRPRADLPHDPKYSRFASAALLESVRPRPGPVPGLNEFAFPILAQSVAAIVRAGGHAAIGEHGENPGIGSHWEMWTYGTAMKPLEVLRMATISGARFVGLDQDVGSLKAGKLADLVVLNRNPLEDLHNTVDIAYVMKGGRLYDAATLKRVDSRRH